MEGEMKIGYYSPSYRRTKIVETHRYLPWIKYVVMESEAQEYRNNNPGVIFKTCPDKVQGNFPRVKNWIIDNYMGENDALLIFDDDITRFNIWQNYQKKPIVTNDFPAWAERMTLLAQEWGTRLWGVNIGPDRMYYKTNTPFSTTAFICGPFQAVMRGNAVRFDERFMLKSDYDFNLQNINKYRMVMRVNNVFLQVRQYEQPGGLSAIRTLSREKKAFVALQKKWGEKIVTVSDRAGIAHNRKKTKLWQINPIIRIPINGV